MAEGDANRAEHAAHGFGLEGFRHEAADEGLSLDQLSQAFAQMLGTGADPYVGDEAADFEEVPIAAERDGTPSAATDPACEVSPRSILEAMLFVGSPAGGVLTSSQVAGLMRGVRPAEIDDLVRDLNRSYDACGCPYHIVSEGAGYRLALRPEYLPVKEKFAGRVRARRLSPAALEVLALVAYNEPITADDVNRLRGTASGAVLTQLVRRQLLRIERGESHVAQYYAAPRFLELFGIERLEELPRSQDLDHQ